MVLVGCVCGHNRGSLEEMRVDFGVLVNLHFLLETLESVGLFRAHCTYHLEGVKLLFDLLSEHWG